MSAAEIIERIKALPPQEQEEVKAFVSQLQPPVSPHAEVCYASEEAVAKAADKIFTKYPGLFKKLAE